jgi:hypothetical protein
MALKAPPVTRLRHTIKFGRNENIDASAVPVADDGVTVANWRASAAAATNVISGDDADNGGTATGALTVRISGVDGNYDYVEEEATLNGTTQVNLTTQFLRVFRIEVLTAGSGLVNAGAIDVRHTTTVLARITAGNNQTLMAMMTVPAGHKGSLEDLYGEIEKSGGGTAYITYKLWTQKLNEAKRLRHIFSAASGGASSVQHQFALTRPHAGISLEEGEDVWIEGTASTTDQTGNAGFEIHYST